MSGHHQATCEERIGSELANVEQSYSKLWRQLDDAIGRGDNAAEEEAREELAPLSLETKRVLKIMFSWGGPSDWIEAELESEGHGYAVGCVTYHFADWFDHAERPVSEREAPALWRVAEYYADHADIR